MVDHPLIPKEVREYMAEHDIVAFLNQNVNKILLQMPPDPLATLGVNFLKSSKSVPAFVKFVTKEILVGSDFRKTMQVDVWLDFQGSPRFVCSYFFEQNAGDRVLVNEDGSMQGAVEALNKSMNEMLAGKLLSNMKAIDALLLTAAQESAEQFDFKNVTYLGSLALAKAVAQCQGNGDIYEGIYKRVRGKTPSRLSDYGFPGIAITLLKGGKALNSKVKFGKFTLMVPGAVILEHPQFISLFLKIKDSFKKATTSSKWGEAGFKPQEDGSYFAPCDMIAEALKFMDDLCASIDPRVRYSVTCDATGYHIKDGNKYEMEGAKAPVEVDQIIDYYAKLCTEHPLIEFWEDSLASDDAESWHKLETKFKDLPTKIGAREMVSSSLEALRKVTEFVQVPANQSIMTSKANESGEAPPQGEENKEEQQQQPDPNASKIALESVHMDPSAVNTFSELVQFIAYTNNYKHGEKKMNLFLGDYSTQTGQSFLFDVCLGGNVSYLNLRGFNRTGIVNRIAEVAPLFREKSQQS